MSIKPLFGLRVAASMTVLAGVGALAMGLGLIDLDPYLEAVAAVVLGIAPSKSFFVFLGTSKLLVALGLWGLGIFPKPLAFVALGTPAACAFYGHSQLGDRRALVPAIYLLILATLAVLDDN